MPCADGSMVTLKVKRGVLPSNMLAGVAEVARTTKAVQQPRADQIVMVTEGWAEAVVGSTTIQLGPGSVVRVPPGVARRFKPRGGTPLRYFFVLSGEAENPCGTNRASRTTETLVSIEPGDGERISYCLFPLTVTFKIDADSAPGNALTLAGGQLRAGKEEATHKDSDELVYITRGKAQAIAGDARVPVERGSLVVNPRGTYHGFVKEGSDTLDYAVVFSDSVGRSGFRSLATRPGPYCAAGPQF